MGYTGVVAAVSISGLLAIYINYPPPLLSKQLTEWKDKGQYLSLKDVQVFYVDEKGKGTGGSLICIHGFPTSSFDWTKLLPDLKQKFSQIVLLDLLGYGFSDKPTQHEYTTAEQADFVEALAKELGISSAHILAHDYGDTVAIELLARHNSRELYFQIRSLTMLNGGIFPETNFPRLSQKLLLTPVVGYIASHLFNFQFFSRGFGEVFGAKKPSTKEFEDFWAALRYNNGDKINYKLINYIRERTTFKDRWVGALKSTQLRVLMIHGLSDPVNQPVFVDHFKKTLPAHTIVTLDPEVGHYPQWEDPRAVSREFLKFIDDAEHL